MRNKISVHGGVHSTSANSRLIYSKIFFSPAEILWSAREFLFQRHLSARLADRNFFRKIRKVLLFSNSYFNSIIDFLHISHLTPYIIFFLKVKSSIALVCYIVSDIVLHTTGIVHSRSIKIHRRINVNYFKYLISF